MQNISVGKPGGGEALLPNWAVAYSKIQDNFIINRLFQNWQIKFLRT